MYACVYVCVRVRVSCTGSRASAEVTAFRKSFNIAGKSARQCSRSRGEHLERDDLDVKSERGYQYACSYCPPTRPTVQQATYYIAYPRNVKDRSAIYEPRGGAECGVGGEGRGGSQSLLRGLGRCLGGVVGAQGLEDGGGCCLRLPDQELAVSVHHHISGQVNGNNDGYRTDNVGPSQRYG